MIVNSSGAEVRKRRLNLGDRDAHPGRVVAPGEVDPEQSLAAGAAEPE